MKQKLASLTFIVGILFTFLTSDIQAWLDCPYGKINDPYPGSCELYIDANNDQLCDHSQPEPGKRVTTPVDKTNSKSSSLFSNPKFWVTFLPVTIYFLSWFITFHTNINKKLSIFSSDNFRFKWNTILLISFSLTSVTSLWLFWGEPNLTLSRLHNYSGIVVLEIGSLHFIRRFSYFTSFVKKLPKTKKT